MCGQPSNCSGIPTGAQWMILVYELLEMPVQKVEKLDTSTNYSRIFREY
jgi:hypothetical protein